MTKLEEIKQVIEDHGLNLWEGPHSKRKFALQSMEYHPLHQELTLTLVGRKQSVTKLCIPEKLVHSLTYSTEPSILEVDMYYRLNALGLYTYVFSKSRKRLE